MSYRQFEHIFFSLALTIILATMLLSMANQASMSELIGQALVVPIVYVSLHYGRQRGLLMAFLATLAYILIKVNEGLKANLLTNLSLNYPFFLRATLFGLIGVAFGELATRAKYLLYQLENKKHIDTITSLYSRYHLENLTSSLIHEYKRYRHPFAVIVFEVSWLATGETIPSASEIKAKIGQFLKRNIRSVDEAGVWDAHTFLVLMPHTVEKGALKAAKRLTFLANQYFKNSFSDKDIKINIKAKTLAYPANQENIDFLLQNQGVNVPQLENQRLN